MRQMHGTLSTSQTRGKHSMLLCLTYRPLPRQSWCLSAFAYVYSLDRVSGSLSWFIFGHVAASANKWVSLMVLIWARRGEAAARHHGRFNRVRGKQWGNLSTPYSTIDRKSLSQKISPAFGPIARGRFGAARLTAARLESCHTCICLFALCCFSKSLFI